MIKKFKNWYNNLLSFQKVRFLELVLGIIFYFLSLFFFILWYGFNIVYFIGYIFVFCPLVALGSWAIIEAFYNTVNEEFDYKLKKMYKDAENEINLWFSSVCSDCIKVNIKSTEASAEILSYYHNKHLLVNSFYVKREKTTSDKKTRYYIYADCDGKQDKVVFPNEITNPRYILANFTLAN